MNIPWCARQRARRTVKVTLKWPVKWAALLLAAAVLAVAVLAAAPARPAQAQVIEPASPQVATISPALAQELAAADGPVSFLAVLRAQPDPAAILAADGLASARAADRRAALYAALTAEAAAAQAPLRAWLDARGVAYTPHYLVNMIEVRGDAALAAQLRLRPEIDRLAANPAWGQVQAPSVTGAPRAVLPARSLSRLRLPFQAQAGPNAPADLPAALPYGLTFTHADQVWALGFRGQGVVIGSQDTGVQWDHPALAAAYRGWDATTQTAAHAYNWLDAFGRDPLEDAGCDPDAQIPCDDQGHGTHTVGTMVGDATTEGGDVLGMAPAAQWIGCRNMRGGVGTPASYTTCFEWFLAPYPQGGDPFRDGKPELAPDIVNNSWGCPPYEGCEDPGILRQVAETVRAAGIFIAASAGNGGAACSTINDPIAIYDSVFTTGAHDAGGNIASFSSRGPVTVDSSGRLKPDITAPGVAVYSTYPTNTYTWLSGTSMASPHVAGAVALLWSAVPTLKGEIATTEDILVKSAEPVATNTCGTDFMPVAPNNVYGYGRLDILAAVNLARQPVTLTVSLVSSASLPIAGRVIELADQRTGRVYTGLTDAGGQVVWPAGAQLTPGSYDVRVQECVTLAPAGSIALTPGAAASKTVVTAVVTCQFLPWLPRGVARR
jgi:subtilisin family serine protease